MKPIPNYAPSSPNNIVDLSTALPCLKDSAAWKKRTEDVRENEWALYQKSLAALHQALDRMLARPFDPVTIGELCNLIEVAFALGRRACGLPAQRPDKKDPNGDAAFMREVDHMLNKVYGSEHTASPPPPRSDLGWDAAPPTSASVARPNASTSAPAEPPAAVNSNTGAPPDKPNRNNGSIDLAAKTHVPFTEKTDETSLATSKSNEDGTEPPLPRKNKPYWLNGHYYSNPEYPEPVARAMFANSQRSARRS